MGKPQSRRMKTQNALTIRATISFPSELYETLERIAAQKKVSLAWVVRSAAENYVVEEEQEGGKNDGRRGR